MKRHQATRVAAALFGGGLVVILGCVGSVAISGLAAGSVLGLATVHQRLPLPTVALVTLVFGCLLVAHGTVAEAGITGAYAGGLLAGRSERR